MSPLAICVLVVGLVLFILGLFRWRLDAGKVLAGVGLVLVALVLLFGGSL